MPRKVTPESEDPAATGSGSGGEEEEEYEIEEVLDAKRGLFPEGRIGYLVKWKGYDADQNSWVDEQDAENASELVEEFWRKHPKKKGRKSVDKKRATQEESEDDNSAAAAAAVAKKKRGRKSSAKDESDDDMDVDVPAKKKSNRQSKAAAAASDEEEQEPKDIKTMDSFMHIKNWEKHVKVVDTVEKDASGNLYIYFTLTTGESVRAKSDICKDRFPRKLLDFYEDNLRWRSAQED